MRQHFRLGILQQTSIEYFHGLPAILGRKLFAYPREHFRRNK